MFACVVLPEIGKFGIEMLTGGSVLVTRELVIFNGAAGWVVFKDEGVLSLRAVGAFCVETNTLADCCTGLAVGLGEIVFGCTLVSVLVLLLFGGKL